MPPSHLVIGKNCMKECSQVLKRSKRESLQDDISLRSINKNEFIFFTHSIEYVLLQSFKGLRLGIRTGSVMYHLLHAHTDLCFMKYKEKTADADHSSLQVL
ncbi:uncharacterized protein DS421_16g532080 [Arachis hypogaea]|nr:uncharacterized protein DS421_16g531900 [Arachis hypogaea]QHN84812.1 uncharacterized protein DS421_16g531940 [Arachis hypogaea]QHN84827.1 uncharacterized protein DS421_16g532080 [Arachis hypogaea]